MVSGYNMSSSGIKQVHIDEDSSKSHTRKKKKEKVKVEHEHEETEEETEESSSDATSTEEEEEDEDTVSFSTTDILTNDPLYFVLSKIFMTKDGVSIATLMQEMNEKLDLLVNKKKSQH